jgi:DNA segregation ATPase FtsK/SpoIIIE-like protein
MTKPIYFHIADLPTTVLNNKIGLQNASILKNRSPDSQQLMHTHRRKHFLQNQIPNEQDELYHEAEKVVRESGKASTSYLQRKLGIGYAHAAKLMDMHEIHAHWSGRWRKAKNGN